jgi:Lrp/AsnC family transcriptional regulator for asnA, asnC and gidA
LDEKDDGFLDHIDRQILHFLRQDGRMPYTSIAEALNLAESTVRKRVNRLLDEGILKIVGVINPLRVGRFALAIVGVNITGANLNQVLIELGKLPEVRYVAVCTGTYDLVLEVAVPDTESLFVFLTETLRSIPGVTGSDTSLVMKVCKERYEWEAAAQKELPCGKNRQPAYDEIGDEVADGDGDEDRDGGRNRDGGRIKVGQKVDIRRNKKEEAT